MAQQVRQFINWNDLRRFFFVDHLARLLHVAQLPDSSLCVKLQSFPVIQELDWKGPAFSPFLNCCFDGDTESTLGTYFVRVL